LDDHWDLLFLRNDVGDAHYCYIKNFRRLVSYQATKNRSGVSICKRCFTKYHISSDGVKKLKEHIIHCKKHKEARIDMPNKDNCKINFLSKRGNVEKEIQLPIAIYADFELVLKRVENNSIRGEMSTSLQQYEALSYCLYVKSTQPEKVSFKLPKEPFVYRKTCDNEDVAEHFEKYIQKIALDVREIYERYDPMTPLTEEQIKTYNESKICYLCQNEFSKKNYKCRDHNHLDGEYRGAACRICNLNNRKPRVLPICFHSLSSYDSHLICKQLSPVPGGVELIPNTEENYISFTKNISNNKCRFLDSYRFMSSSLAQ
jgi:hypothetical protein